MGKEKYENLGCAGKSGFESGDQTVKLINRGDIFVDTKRFFSFSIIKFYAKIASSTVN